MVDEVKIEEEYYGYEGAHEGAAIAGKSIDYCNKENGATKTVHYGTIAVGEEYAKFDVNLKPTKPFQSEPHPETFYYSLPVTIDDVNVGNGVTISLGSETDAVESGRDPFVAINKDGKQGPGFKGLEYVSVSIGDNSEYITNPSTGETEYKVPSQGLDFWVDSDGSARGRELVDVTGVGTDRVDYVHQNLEGIEEIAAVAKKYGLHIDGEVKNLTAENLAELTATAYRSGEAEVESPSCYQH